MAATFGSCASVLQLGFGLNAVSAAVEIQFKGSFTRLIARLYNDVRPEADQLEGPEVEIAFSKYIYLSSRGLRIARNIYPFLMLVGASLLFVSFLGLVLGAVDTNQPIADRAVWSYAILSLLVSPTIYWSFQRFLRWFEHKYLEINAATAEQRENVWQHFRDFYPLDVQLREIQAFAKDAEELRFELEKSRLLLRLQRWRLLFPRWFR